MSNDVVTVIDDNNLVVTDAAPIIIEVAAIGPQGALGPTGPTGGGTQGVAGPTGPAGVQGQGLAVLGAVATVGDLPTTGNVQGDSWVVQATGVVYVWTPDPV